MASTASSVAPWIAPTWVLISSVATTTNTLPASPARAASMVAFSADKLVYSAISLISSTISPMSFTDSERLSTLSFAPCIVRRLFGNIGRTFDQLRNSANRRTEFFCSRCNRLDVCRRDVGGLLERFRLLLHFHRLSRHAFRGCFQFRRVGRNRPHDFTKHFFEILGHSVHFNALFCGSLRRCLTCVLFLVLDCMFFNTRTITTILPISSPRSATGHWTVSPSWRCSSVREISSVWDRSIS